MLRESALKPSGCSIPETPEIPVPKPPETIFKPLAEVPQVPMHVLEHFWKKRESHIARTRACDGPNSEELAGKASILDEKKLQMLGITLKRHEHHLRKHRMQREEISRWEAIASIKQAILRCDFEILQIECLSVIRTVIKQHENDGKPVTVFAEANGEAALRSCRCPEGHCLVFELCKAQCAAHEMQASHENTPKAVAQSREDDVWIYKVLGVKPHVLRLSRMRDAQLLYDRLKNAHQTAFDHLQAGGSYVKIFLAQLAIPALSSKVRFLVDRDMDSDEALAKRALVCDLGLGGWE
eukprot:s1105_g6.t1